MDGDTEIHASSSRIDERHHRGADGQGATLKNIERHMAVVIGGRSIEDGERTVRCNGCKAKGSREKEKSFGYNYRRRHS